MMAQPDFGVGVDAVDFMEDGQEPPQPFGVLAPSSTLPAGHPGAGGARYYTIQRVNGGANGKESEGGGHKHTLEESDAIKKNSVRRNILKEEKDKKRMDVSRLFLRHPALMAAKVLSCQTSPQSMISCGCLQTIWLLFTSQHLSSLLLCVLPSCHQKC
jgi:hypothetical protein